MLISEKINLKWSNAIKKYYENKGYVFTGRSSEFTVDIKDLSPKATAIVDVKCDYCGKIIQKQYSVYLKQRKILEKDACSKCAVVKSNESIKSQCIENKRYKNALVKINDYNFLKKEKFISNFIEKSKEKDYVLLPFIYTNSKDKYMYVCNKHTELGIQYASAWNICKSNNTCKKCISEYNSNIRKFDYEYVKEEVEKNGKNKLLSTDYSRAIDKLLITCSECGNPYEITFNKLRYKDYGVCRSCWLKNNVGENSSHWLGGRTSLNCFLRCSINDWKKASLEHANYTCDISGMHSRKLEVHHAYKSFRDIVEEVLSETGLDVRSEINEYSIDELIVLKDKCVELHNKYGFGICIESKYHQQFHNLYGRFNNTIEQYIEFKNNVLNNTLDTKISL